MREPLPSPALAGVVRPPPAYEQRAPAEAVYLCDRCGAVLQEVHCKLMCTRCGMMRDCSDP
ncbi:MAG: hypothetical protein HYU88_05265 [Chloroflexi bacterium]|nr:hypothetical protein [Chloroflexota bacterium]MBI4505826.1 hypothetical protein [Chloroflexota bacterium]